MARAGWQVWILALAFVLAAAPLSFLAGTFAMAGLQYAFGPPVSGEALQGVAFAAFLFGGPIGLVIGSLLAGWVGYRMGRVAKWPAVLGTLVVLGVISARALVELGIR